MKPLRHPASLERGDKVDGWTVVEPLGSNTSGTIFLVEQAGRRCVLKFATHREDREDPKQTNERARRELLCLMLMRGPPNVIRALGSGHWPHLERGWLYLILDHVRGLTLAQWVRKTHATAGQAVRLFVKLFAAMAHLHSRRVFHPSLTVTHILVREDGEPFITDFSAGDYVFTDLLEDKVPPLTHEDTLRMGEDVHALGMCLYDVLTTALPERYHRTGEAGPAMLPTARAVNPRVPGRLSDAVMALMSGGPGQWLPAAGEALRLLEGLASQDGEEWTVPLHPPEAVLEAEARARAIPFAGR
ncbi:MAG TPA: protein kinase [Myxococcus sp.]|nr:protein kinase [Myxococcus sp.]